MPLHDWSRVPDRMFHHFHNSWIYKVSDRLNDGLLPPGVYAAGEQVAGEIEPDMLTLERQSGDTGSPMAVIRECSHGRRRAAANGLY